MTIITLATLALALGAAPASAGPDLQETSLSAADLEAKGDSVRLQKDYNEAIRLYRRALRAGGGNEATLYTKIGQANLRLHLYAHAQVAFEQAYKRNPTDPHVLNNLGVASHLRRKYDRAVKWYKKALALNEAEPAFHYNLAGSWFALARFDRANAEYARALELDPIGFASLEEQSIAGQPSEADRGRLYYMMARLYASRGDLERALIYLQKAKDRSYAGLANVYRDREFVGLRNDARLAQVVRPPGR